MRLRLLTLLTVYLGCTLVLGLIFRPPAEEPVPALEPAAVEVLLPLSGLRILVDPGHGGYDGGARARDSGTWEKHINLAVALEVEKALTAQGAAVTLTRREDDDLCDDAPVGITKKRQDMERRVAMGAEMPADLVLSIHMNEYRDRRQSGPQVFYRKDNDAGRLLAGCMQEALINGLSPKQKRTALAGDYFILRLPVPSVLIECGFISNSEEAKTASFHGLSSPFGSGRGAGRYQLSDAGSPTLRRPRTKSSGSFAVKVMRSPVRGWVKLRL